MRKFWRLAAPHRQGVVDQFLALKALPEADRMTVRRPVRWQLGAIKTLAQWHAKWGTA